MNILVVHNSYRQPGGEDTVFQAEVELLQKHGHSISIYERSNLEMDHFTGWKKLISGFQAIYNPRVFREITKIIAEKKIDLVHVHNTFFIISPAVYYAAQKSNVPVIQTIHNFRFICANALLFRDGKVCEECIYHGKRNALHYKCYHNSFAQTFLWYIIQRFHEKRNIFQDLTYICMTEFDADIFKKGMGDKIDPERVIIKPHFIEDRCISFQERAELEKDKGDFIFLGRLSIEKGVDDLINAWPEDQNYRLHIYGDGPERTRLEEKAKGLNKYILFHGKVSHEQALEKIYTAKALIFSSICYETFGLTIVESMMLGTPVIANNIGNGADLVEKVCHETVIDMKDSHQLQRALEYVIRHPELKKEFRKEYEEKYSAHTNYSMLMEAYKTVLLQKK